MPTGYTADLYEGKEVSFRDFVLRCSRGMGAAVLLRDHDMSVVPTPENINGGVSDYAERRLETCLEELEHWRNLKGPALLAETEAYNAKQREGLAKEEESRQRIEAAYTGMIAQVEAWDPPTPDHEGFKDFMLEQLRDSLKFDASPVDAKWYSELVPADLRDLKLGNLQREIERLKGDIEKNRERDAGRIAWIEALYESLPPASEEVKV